MSPQATSHGHAFSSHRRQIYVVTLTEAEKARPFFNHPKDDVCTVNAQLILRVPGVPFASLEVTDPGIGEPTHTFKYEIHPGYRRVLAGFLREIDFMRSDGLMFSRVISRGIYLMKVLDRFVMELVCMPKESLLRFRSRALNPLLQRQLRGLDDNDDPSVYRFQIGETLEDAARFYLFHDPLAPAHNELWQKNFIYNRPVRMSLSLLGTRATDEDYVASLVHTSMLLEGCIQAKCIPGNSDGLWDFEVKVIRLEGLQPYFTAFEIPVSSRCSFDKRFDVHNFHLAVRTKRPSTMIIVRGTASKRRFRTRTRGSQGRRRKRRCQGGR